MTEPVYWTHEIVVPENPSRDVELLSALSSTIAVMRGRHHGQIRFDDACVARCARHLVEQFTEPKPPEEE